MFTGVVAGVAAAIFYRLVVQQAVPSLPAVVVSVLPFILIGALARASPKTAIPAVDFNMCFLLASQAGMPATDTTTVLVDALALVAAAALTSGGHLLMPRQAEKHAAAVARAIRQDISGLIARYTPSRRQGWNPHASRRMLRLLLHLRRAGELGDVAPHGLLAALILGHAVMDLRLVARDDARPATVRAEAEATLTMLADFATSPDADLADRAADTDLSRATFAAADALAAGRALFAYGT